MPLEYRVPHLPNHPHHHMHKAAHPRQSCDPPLLALVSGECLARKAVGVAPAGLAQIDGDLLLLVLQRTIRTLLEQQLHNLNVTPHGRPMKRCVIALNRDRAKIFVMEE